MRSVMKHEPTPPSVEPPFDLISDRIISAKQVDDDTLEGRTESGRVFTVKRQDCTPGEWSLNVEALANYLDPESGRGGP